MLSYLTLAHDTRQVCVGGTIVVCDINFNPALRGWCIFEWDHTLLHHGLGGLHMPVSVKDCVILVNSINVELAECYMPADKTMILDKVCEHHGDFHTFNSRLKRMLLLKPLSFKADMSRHLPHVQATQWRWDVVQKWLDGDCRALCVMADAGTGKSCISAAIIDHFKSNPSHVWAFHFLKHDDQRRLEPLNVIKTLVAQLCSR